MSTRYKGFKDGHGFESELTHPPTCIIKNFNVLKYQIAYKYKDKKLYTDRADILTP